MSGTQKYGILNMIISTTTTNTGDPLTRPAPSHTLQCHFSYSSDHLVEPEPVIPVYIVRLVSF